MSAITDPAAVLDKAADALAERRLIKGQYCDNDDEPDCLCAVGAISFAAYGDPEMYGLHVSDLEAVLIPLAKIIAPELGTDDDLIDDLDAYDTITRYNDLPATTRGHVVAAMRAAARKLREGGDA